MPQEVSSGSAVRWQLQELKSRKGALRREPLSGAPQQRATTIGSVEALSFQTGHAETDVARTAEISLAEREGFEPPIGLHLCRISSAVHSTTLPPLLKAPYRSRAPVVGGVNRRGWRVRQGARDENQAGFPPRPTMSRWWRRRFADFGGTLSGFGLGRSLLSRREGRGCACIAESLVWWRKRGWDRQTR